GLADLSRSEKGLAVTTALANGLVVTLADNKLSISGQITAQGTAVAFDASQETVLGGFADAQGVVNPRIAALAQALGAAASDRNTGEALRSLAETLRSESSQADGLRSVTLTLASGSVVHLDAADAKTVTLSLIGQATASGMIFKFENATLLGNLVNEGGVLKTGEAAKILESLGRAAATADVSQAVASLMQAVRDLEKLTGQEGQSVTAVLANGMVVTATRDTLTVTAVVTAAGAVTLSQPVVLALDKKFIAENAATILEAVSQLTRMENVGRAVAVLIAAANKAGIDVERLLDLLTPLNRSAIEQKLGLGVILNKALANLSFINVTGKLVGDLHAAATDQQVKDAYANFADRFVLAKQEYPDVNIIEPRAILVDEGMKEDGVDPKVLHANLSQMAQRVNRLAGYPVISVSFVGALNSKLNTNDVTLMMKTLGVEKQNMRVITDRSTANTLRADFGSSVVVVSREEGVNRMVGVLMGALLTSRGLQSMNTELKSQMKNGGVSFSTKATSATEHVDSLFDSSLDENIHY
ncbi:MAG TPA: hypothetical protein VL404_06410, partial [Candidatus Eisenbacteria bacterium]|nr:hypothetical protein [Candidatus Eisenbacteria bacterium]